MFLSDKPLKIEGELCGKRIIDSLYKAGDKYYFLDVGWADDGGGHPDHCIGKLIKTEEERWTFQDAENDNAVFVIAPINDTDTQWGEPMLKGYNDWNKYLKDNYPKADREKFIKRAQGIPNAERIA